jgi:hypothetical protein
MNREQQLIERIADEIDTKGPMHLAISAIEVFRLVGMLQLAARHPAPSEDNRRAVRWFVEHARAHFADCPGLLEVIRRGDDPSEDRAW